jgi:small GTP-binding protein
MLPIKVFLFGIDNAGKTALSKALKGEKVTETEPTITFDITKLVIKQVEFAVWDAPGQIKFRVAWKEGLQKAQVLMFVVDVTDSPRFDESKSELDKVLNTLETARIPLVICFNKMDLPAAQKNHKLALEKFKIQNIRDRKVYSFETTITKPESLNAVKEKLAEIIQKARWSS